LPHSPTTSGDLSALYGLWVGSWETALAAVATATQTRMLSLKVAAAHKAAIAAERKLVMKHLAQLDAGTREFADAS
jgi:uncharacterized membrane protein YdjX (TVP38/TMEM64 family)